MKNISEAMKEFKVNEEKKSFDLDGKFSVEIEGSKGKYKALLLDNGSVKSVVKLEESVDEKANDVGVFDAVIKKMFKAPYGDYNNGFKLVVDMDGDKVPMETILHKKGIEGKVSVGDDVKVNVSKNAYRMAVDKVMEK